MVVSITFHCRLPDVNKAMLRFTDAIKLDPVLSNRKLHDYLARLAKLPTRLYILPSVISFFFLNRQIISGSTGSIFAIFAPNDRYLFEYDRAGTLFLIPQGTLPWQPVKVRKSAFFSGQSTLSRCHSVMDCNITIPISKVTRQKFTTFLRDVAPSSVLLMRTFR